MPAQDTGLSSTIPFDLQDIHGSQTFFVHSGTANGARGRPAMTEPVETSGAPTPPESGAPSMAPGRARKKPARAFPTILQAIGLLVLVLVLQGIISFLFLLVDPPSGEFTQHPLALALGNVLAFGLVILIATRRSGVGWRVAYPLSSVSPGALALTAILFLGTVILLSDVDNLTRSVFPPPAALSELFEGLMNTRERPFSSFFLLVVVAPVTEEMLFRGLILRGFLGNYSKRSAILLSALLFAMLHTNPWQFIPTFVAGVLLAWLLVETGSLIPCLFAHAVANGTAWLAGLFPVEIPGFTDGMGGPVQFQPFWLNALGVAFVVTGYMLLRRSFRQKSHPPGDHYRRSPTP